MSRLRVLMATREEELAITVNSNLPPKYPAGCPDAAMCKTRGTPSNPSGRITRLPEKWNRPKTTSRMRLYVQVASLRRRSLGRSIRFKLLWPFYSACTSRTQFSFEGPLAINACL